MSPPFVLGRHRKHLAPHLRLDDQITRAMARAIWSTQVFKAGRGGIFTTLIAPQNHVTSTSFSVSAASTPLAP